MKQILQEEKIKVRVMVWEQLGYEIRLECIGKIVKNFMGSMHYCKCIICKKG